MRVGRHLACCTCDFQDIHLSDETTPDDDSARVVKCSKINNDLNPRLYMPAPQDIPSPLPSLIILRASFIELAGSHARRLITASFQPCESISESFDSRRSDSLYLCSLTSNILSRTLAVVGMSSAWPCLAGGLSVRGCSLCPQNGNLWISCSRPTLKVASEPRGRRSDRQSMQHRADLAGSTKGSLVSPMGKDNRNSIFESDSFNHGLPTSPSCRYLGRAARHGRRKKVTIQDRLLRVDICLPDVLGGYCSTYVCGQH